MYQISTATDNIFPGESPKGFANGVTRFYSRIADRSAIAATWHYIRGLDHKGSGWARFSLSEAAATLKVTIATIRRHLREGKRAGFINWFLTKGGIATAAYASREKVCFKLGLDDFGAVAEVYLTDLSASKELAAEVEAISMQRSSQLLARKESKRNTAPIRDILNPSLNAQTSDGDGSKAEVSWGTRSSVLWIGDRYTFVGSDFVTYGASQAGIGKRMDRHERTIKRRLSAAQRDKKGLHPLHRKQIAQEEQHPESYQVYASLFEAPGKIFQSGSKSFVARCNIYQPCYDLISVRFARKALSRKAAKNITIANRDAGEGE